MERLTEFSEKVEGIATYYAKNSGVVAVGRIIEKLGQKEDDDEELGIDSHILFKALKNGIVFNCPSGYPVMVDGRYITIDIEEKIIRWNDLKGFAKISDYGKTWALTKEELEDGK